MMWIKRIGLFLLVNFLVIMVVTFLLSFFNVQPYLSKRGLNLNALAFFCLFWGMTGALISLALSRIMAKWMMGLQLLTLDEADPEARRIVETVYRLAKKAGLPVMPEVALYQSPELNAFATGPSRSRSLVAVSSGLIQRMPPDQVEAVIGHEITHIANGDMVTMTLLQGIVNAFVMFLSRIIAFAVSRAFAKKEGEEESSVSPVFFHVLTFIFEMVFMVLGSIVVASFSRYREFRADAGGARLSTPLQMIGALKTLGKAIDIQDETHEQPAFQSLKISHRSGMLSWFASHPPLEERIRRLEERMARKGA